ncbi:hypothetical protein PV11_00322 [Exophiala sideris]|uniref:Heterokaryon incompatibility domain-containing protein n=1 Tax=Exophiala sideris TaxID=1016849 RepID=A0A0D1ZCR3_9EURO|nr:hypothetical protein PV11_00322 [Exophiala sideris]
MLSNGSSLGSLGFSEAVQSHNHLLHDAEYALPRCCQSISQGPQDSGSRSFPLLPTRVIDLGLGHPYSSAKSIRLHLATLSERAPYVALSHRWGLGLKERMPSMTTLANISQQCAKIDFNDLPRTFQDAVKVTRMLGIHYLWIDAICIIQDDPRDWRLQSTKMGFIFEHASVTIAAHSSRNSADGFLRRRKVPECALTQAWDYNGAFEMVYMSEPKLTFAGNIGKSEINHRAWCLQELCLSRRIMHFVEDEVMWECFHKPVNLPGNQTPAQVLRITESLRELPNWLSIVEHYSSCKMTYRKDKLAAIAGLARLWAIKSGAASTGSYHSGIWEDNLYTGLLWMNAGTDGNRLVKTWQPVPTWSWASVDGEIQFHPGFWHGDRKSLSKRVSDDIVTLSFNYPDHGRSTDRYLGGKCTLRLRAMVAEGLTLSSAAQGEGLSFAPPSHGELSVLWKGSKTVGWASLDNGFPLDEDFPSGPGGPMLHYIRISSVRGDNGRRCYVLVVRKDDKGDYVRLGLGCITQTDVFDNHTRRVVSIR